MTEFSSSQAVRVPHPDLSRSPGHRARCLALLLSAPLLLQACTMVGASTVPPRSRGSDPSPAVWTETGVASWYGEPFHGRKTASGEKYDMNDLTCAHPTLAFGTRLRVENLDNGRSITVRVNDRGPFKKERILDVSRKAAQELGMIGPGTAQVRISVVESGQE